MWGHVVGARVPLAAERVLPRVEGRRAAARKCMQQLERECGDSVRVAAVERGFELLREVTRRT